MRKNRLKGRKERENKFTREYGDLNSDFMQIFNFQRFISFSVAAALPIICTFYIFIVKARAHRRKHTHREVLFNLFYLPLYLPLFLSHIIMLFCHLKFALTFDHPLNDIAITKEPR